MLLLLAFLVLRRAEVLGKFSPAQDCDLNCAGELEKRPSDHVACEYHVVCPVSCREITGPFQTRLREFE